MTLKEAYFHLRRVAPEIDSMTRQLGHNNHANYTITSTIVIRVTPKEDYLVSWAILWTGFILAAGAALWQLCWEFKRRSDRRHLSDGADRQVDEVSTADVTRNNFRQMLLVALISRSIFMPVMIWSDPLIWQFVGDTLPEIFFVSAWFLMVGFFVQLVGIATNGSAATIPGVPMLLSALTVYACLVVLQIQNQVASVLMYALLCCIYAALLGAVGFFGPKMLTVLAPSLGQQSGATIRLMVSTSVCVVLFSAHVLSYAKRVIAPPSKVYWWYHYGVLELFPSIIFLVLMNSGPRKGSSAPETSNTRRKMIRVDSANSATSAQRRQNERAALMRPTTLYGADSGDDTT